MVQYNNNNNNRVHVKEVVCAFNIALVYADTVLYICYCYYCFINGGNLEIEKK